MIAAALKSRSGREMLAFNTILRSIYSAALNNIYGEHPYRKSGLTCTASMGPGLRHIDFQDQYRLSHTEPVRCKWKGKHSSLKRNRFQ